jgi:hypothetical protein
LEAKGSPPSSKLGFKARRGEVTRLEAKARRGFDFPLDSQIPELLRKW